MTSIAEQVRVLRERTGAGMMDCKRALEAANGDMELAVEELRKAGIVKADKKASRVAAEGIVIIRATSDHKRVVMLEINCETDFVARDANFIAFTEAAATTALQHHFTTVDQLSSAKLSDGTTVDEARRALIAKIGENISIRRIAMMETSQSTLGSYLHGNRIGVLVELQGQDSLAKDIAMHVAASKPLVILPEAVPQDVIAKEKEIFLAQAAQSNKPKEIIEKMVQGKLKKFLDEVSLVGQPFIKDPDVTVGDLLNKHNAKVIAFTRFEVGEGIEKITEDFVEAVMAQVHGS